MSVCWINDTKVFYFDYCVKTLRTEVKYWAWGVLFILSKLSIHFSLYLQNTKSLLSIYLHEEDTGMVEREMQKMTIETLIENTAQVTSSNDQDGDDGQWIMFHKDGYDCFLENILVMIKSTRSLAKLFQQCSENIPLYETIIWRFSSDIETWLLPKPHRHNTIHKTVFYVV